MLNPLELSLFQAVAVDPEANARYIVSPQAGSLKQWVSTALAKNIFTRIGYLATIGKPVSLISVIAMELDRQPFPEFYTLNKEEVSYLLQAWSDAKTLPNVNIWATIDAIKTDYIVRSANTSMTEAIAKNEAQPSGVLHHIGDVGARLSLLIQEGQYYDPTPSSHRNDPIPTVYGTWGSKAFNNMYDGGIPRRGYSLIIGPSGHGKSTMGRTKAAMLIAQGARVAYCTNESTMPAGLVSRHIHRALKEMWAGTEGKDDEQLWRDMDENLLVYDLDAGTHDINRIKQIAYWTQPQVVVLDSLDNLGWTTGSERADEKEKHRLRANYIAEISADNNCFIVVVGNGSEKEQNSIMNGIDKVNIPMAFGSVWYHNEASYSFIFCRHESILNQVDMKRCKGRDERGIGEMMYFLYNKAGGFYDDQQAPIFTGVYAP